MSVSYPNAMKPAAPERCPGGGSETELVCRYQPQFSLPTQNNGEAKKYVPYRHAGKTRVENETGRAESMAELINDPLVARKPECAFREDHSDRSAWQHRPRPSREDQKRVQESLRPRNHTRQRPVNPIAAIAGAMPAETVGTGVDTVVAAADVTVGSGCPGCVVCCVV